MALDPKTEVEPDSYTPHPNNEVWVEFGALTENLDAQQVTAWVEAARASRTGTVCVRFVGEEEGRSLNSRFRKIFDATNVLAFPAHEKGILGDIAICIPTAAQEALNQGKSLTSHLAHLVVHGTLHLCGYDHNMVEEAEKMEAREAQVLRTFGFDDPYNQNG
ncbi:MAG: rRNA maturation RNase YbeY [Gammaproteobacteria bacterium]|nr:rRNA maturation RNase YbeY [Gammaproteobacteria bacterium]MYD79058.1 rRNA maturation RNase YbeY [Gammaproteobacteria bacterium]